MIRLKTTKVLEMFYEDKKKKKTEALIKYYLNKKSVSSSGCRSAELCGCVSISSSTVVD